MANELRDIGGMWVGREPVLWTTLPISVTLLGDAPPSALQKATIDFVAGLDDSLLHTISSKILSDYLDDVVAELGSDLSTSRLVDTLREPGLVLLSDANCRKQRYILTFDPTWEPEHGLHIQMQGSSAIASGPHGAFDAML